MKKKKYIRLVVLLGEGDKPLLDDLKKISSKYRVSVSAMASYAMKVGLPHVEAHFEKLASKGKENIGSR